MHPSSSVADGLLHELGLLLLCLRCTEVHLLLLLLLQPLLLLLLLQGLLLQGLLLELLLLQLNLLLLLLLLKLLLLQLLHLELLLLLLLKLLLLELLLLLKLLLLEAHSCPCKTGTPRMAHANPASVLAVLQSGWKGVAGYVLVSVNCLPCCGTWNGCTCTASQMQNVA
jgi:hypothetical protein